jgi:hypothetical protein
MFHASHHHVQLSLARSSASPAMVLYSHIAHSAPSLTNPEAEDRTETQSQS